MRRLPPARRVEAGRILRFALVGVSVAAVYAGLYAGLRWGGLAPWLASLIAFCVAVLWQYLAQTAWTFRASLAARGQAMRFGVTVGLGALSATAITGFIGPALGLPEAVGLASVILFLPVQNYIVFRFWVYRNPRIACRDRAG